MVRVPHIKHQRKEKATLEILEARSKNYLPVRQTLPQPHELHAVWMLCAPLTNISALICALYPEVEFFYHHLHRSYDDLAGQLLYEVRCPSHDILL